MGMKASRSGRLYAAIACPHWLQKRAEPWFGALHAPQATFAGLEPQAPWAQQSSASWGPAAWS